MRRRNHKRKKFVRFQKNTSKKSTYVSYPSHVEGFRTIGERTHYFKSLWEINYACLLEWKRLRGDIFAWFYEPKLFEFPMYKTGPVFYLPDFKVCITPQLHEWHEVKGLMTTESRLKINRFEKCFPNEGKVVIRDPSFFVAGNKIYPDVVPGWRTLTQLRESQVLLKPAYKPLNVHSIGYAKRIK